LCRPRVPGQEYKENIGKYRNKVDNKVRQEVNNKVRDSEMIIRKLKKLIKINELVFQTIDILKDRYIYYKFIPINRKAKEEPYIYIKYFLVIANQVGY